jgi:hypothetical protein
MVTLVNCFEVPAGREDEFFSMWQQVNTYMRDKKDTWSTSSIVRSRQTPDSDSLMWRAGHHRRTLTPLTTTAFAHS